MTEGSTDSHVMAEARATVFTIMSHGVRTVPADLSIESLVRVFVEEGLSRVLVVKDSGAPLGVVSRSDLVLRQYLGAETVEDADPRVQRRGGVQAPLGAGFQVASTNDTIADLMSRQVVSVTEETTIFHACETMSRDHLHGVPVISAQHGPIGWLSATDVVRWVADHCR